MSFASDSFTDSAGVTVPNHTMDSGGPWVKHGSYTDTAVISNANRVRSTTTATNYGYYATATPPTADYEVSADLYVASALDSVGVMGRVATGADTMYFARYNVATTRWELYSLVAGTPAILGFYSQSLSASGTYNVKLRMVGDQISAYIDGTLRIGPITNTAVTATGKAGIRGKSGTSDSTGYQLDNFLAVDLGAITHRTFKRLCGPAQLGNSAADLYTVPTGRRAKILSILASNPSAGAVDLTLSIGADASALRVYDGYSLPAGATESNLDPYDLAAGEVIQGFAGTDATVVLTITGIEEPA